MQTAARNLALSGANNLRSGLPAVPVNSYGLVNGLLPAAAVPRNLTSPATGENAALWVGASLPSIAT